MKTWQMFILNYNNVHKFIYCYKPNLPMSPYVAEFFGTLTLILLGNGVVAGVVLKGTKSENAGWVAITIGVGSGSNLIHLRRRTNQQCTSQSCNYYCPLGIWRF